MTLVNQPTFLPTNKMTVAALIGPAFAEFWTKLMAEHVPSLSGDAMSILAGTLAAMVVSYFVRDRANVTPTN